MNYLSMNDRAFAALKSMRLLYVEDDTATRE
jgi:hypothetical protein